MVGFFLGMIIGVTGPICAGKDEVGKILNDLGFERISLVEVLRAEARKRGIELTRKNLQDLGDKLRREEGTDTFAKRATKNIVKGKNYVIESIRNPGEVEALRKLPGFVLLCVNSSDEVRFSRMIARGREKDPRTFDEFLKVEARDKGIGQAAYAQQSEASWKLADHSISNEGSIDDLYQQVETLLSEFKI